MTTTTSGGTATPGMNAEEALQSTALEPQTLKYLFDALRYPVNGGELAQACKRVQTDAAMLPTERMGRILQAMKRRDAQAALLRWERMDLRRLPALVLYEGQWLVAERSDEAPADDAQESMTLNNGLAPALVVPSRSLSGSWVLWLRTHSEERLSAPEAFRSPAARLVLGELLVSKRWLLDVLSATLVVNLLAVASSLFALQVYDRVVPTLAYPTLWALVAGMAIVLTLDWLLKLIRTRVLDGVAREVDLAVSQRVYEHLLELRLDTRPRSVGTLAAQINGLETARSFFSSSIVFALTDLPFALMFIAFIGLIGGAIGWVYLGMLPVALGLGWLAQYRLRTLYREEMHRGTERHGLLVDTIQGIETVQASNSGWRFAEHWQAASRSIADFAIKSRLLTSITMNSTATLGQLAYVLAIIVGVGLIEAGQLTVGGLIASTILGGRVIAPVAQSVQILAQWQQVREALEMVNRLLMTATRRREQQALLLTDGAPDRLQIEGLRFSYPQAPVLRLNIASLSFKAGDRVLLLGPVGSGKSTLLKVAAGLYQPSEGRVRLGTAEMREIDAQIVAEHVAYLAQDVHLFRGTLRSNLIMGSHVNDSRLLQVIELLGIDKISADNPRGLDMEISEGGAGLSGGQRQLVGLARVCLNQPRIWLLDEPTASLDNEAEARAIGALQRLVSPQDIVLIATHRPSLLPLANRVVVMRRGEVLIDGPPETVLASSGGAVKGGQA